LGAAPSQLDPEIRLAIGLPNHPSYPSNHSCTASASGGVLDGLFPDERGRYSALAREIAISRLYAGIHYRIDLDAGREIGRNVAAKVLAQTLAARSRLASCLAIARPSNS
jgi:membrane-associated phospholipid phosphatase